MVRPIVAFVLAAVIVAIAGGAVWYSSVPQSTGWCEKSQPGDAPYITIHSPETLAPETATVRMEGNTLVIDTVGDYVPEGRKAEIRFEMRNAGLGNVFGATFERNPLAGWNYKITFGGTFGDPANPIDMCAGLSFMVFVEIYDNVPGTIQLVDENNVFVGPAQIRIS